MRGGCNDRRLLEQAASAPPTPAPNRGEHEVGVVGLAGLAGWAAVAEYYSMSGPMRG